MSFWWLELAFLALAFFFICKMRGLGWIFKVNSDCKIIWFLGSFLNPSRECVEILLALLCVASLVCNDDFFFTWSSCGGAEKSSWENGLKEGTLCQLKIHKRKLKSTWAWKAWAGDLCGWDLVIVCEHQFHLPLSVNVCLSEWVCVSVSRHWGLC